MTKIDHIGIAVRDLAEAARLYAEGLGLPLAHTEAVPSQGVKVGFVPIGASKIELLEPLDEASPVAKFLEKRGPGIHHVCLRVTDVRASMERLRASGAQLLSEEPLPGADGALVAFVHPKSAHGVLIELLQPAGTPETSDPVEGTPS